MDGPRTRTQHPIDPGSSSGLRSPGAAGWFGVTGGVLWVTAIALEYSRHLQPPTPVGALFIADAVAFALAMGCWIVAIVGLARARLAGDGRARHVLAAWAVGYLLVVVGSLTSLVLYSSGSKWADVYDTNPLPPLGGVIAVFSSLAAGIAIVRTRRLGGWSRWVVAGYSVYVLGALFVPLFFGVDVNAVTETIWGLWWVAIGAVLIEHARRPSLATLPSR